MVPENIRALFNLGEPESVTGTTVLTEDTSAAPLPTSPTALVLDSWSIRKGTEWAKLGGEYSAADIRGAFYEPEPKLYEGPCENPLRQEFMKGLLESEDYRNVHPDTMLNEEFTRLAFDRTSEEWNKVCVQAEKENPGDPYSEPSPSCMTAASRAAGRAAREVKSTTDDLMIAAAGYGLGGDLPGTRLDPTRLAELYKRLKADPKLKRVAEMAGKLRLIARAAQKRKTAHGQDDMIGVTIGGDIHRLVPAELCYLAGDPDLEILELDALRRIAEKTSLVREWNATENVGKGPIIITVDESGSMQGEKEETAKALALTLAWLAKKQNRWCGLVAYSGNSGHRLVALPPGRWDDIAVLDWVTQYIGGGCSRDVPIVEMPDFYLQLGSPLLKTDVIMITDAIVHFSDKEMTDFNKWKESVKARVTGLIIKDKPGDLVRVCDSVYRVPSISADSEEISKVLSI